MEIRIKWIQPQPGTASWYPSRRVRWLRPKRMLVPWILRGNSTAGAASPLVCPVPFASSICLLPAGGSVLFPQKVWSMRGVTTATVRRWRNHWGEEPMEKCSQSSYGGIGLDVDGKAHGYGKFQSFWAKPPAEAWVSRVAIIFPSWVRPYDAWNPATVQRPGTRPGPKPMALVTYGLKSLTHPKTRKRWPTLIHHVTTYFQCFFLPLNSCNFCKPPRWYYRKRQPKCPNAFSQQQNRKYHEHIKRSPTKLWTWTCIDETFLF